MFDSLHVKYHTSALLHKKEMQAYTILILKRTLIYTFSHNTPFTIASLVTRKILDNLISNLNCTIFHF